MGFFQGVVAQLNTIDERNERFAKEERDRAEKRKDMQDALLKSRMDAIVKLASSGEISTDALLGYMSEVGGLGSTDDTTKGGKKESALTVPKPSEKKIPGGLKVETSLKPSSIAVQKGKDIVKYYGANPDVVSKFVARGADHLDELMSVLKARRADWVAAGREAEWEAQGIANKIIEGVSVYVEDPSATVDRRVLDRIDNLGVSAADKAYYRAILSGKKRKSTFKSFDEKPTFFTPDDYDKLDKAFVGAITQTLIRKQKELQRFEPTTDEERVSRADSLRTIERQIEDAKDGVVGFDVIESYGPETFVELAAIQPKLLQQKILPGNLGAARRAYEKSQTAMPTYGTVEEAMAARQRGDIKVGDKIIVAGQTTTVKK